MRGAELIDKKVREDCVAKEVAELFGSLTQGVYVIGVADGDRVNAFTAASVMLVSFNQPHLALSVNIRHSSYQLLKAGGAFSVNVLTKDQQDFAVNYAKPATSAKMSFAAWKPGRTGAPLLCDAMAWFEVEVTGELPAGDHSLILGRVIDGKLVRPDAEPLTSREATKLDADYANEAFPDTLQG
jgi:flavin reductase (DIM6/NTAB) family NADH-FMN oxidoreductase RutF